MPVLKNFNYFIDNILYLNIQYYMNSDLKYCLSNNIVVEKDFIKKSLHQHIKLNLDFPGESLITSKLTPNVLRDIANKLEEFETNLIQDLFENKI